VTGSAFEQAIALIDNANREDPNIETVDGRDWPKEQLYAQRMSDMLQRYRPDTDEVMQLAIRAQHIQRWKSPRSDYPMDRKGYHLWRTNLYSFHAETLSRLMTEAGYNQADIERAAAAVGKKNINKNVDTQLLEDVAALVFIEHYMLNFAGQHPEYDEEKWITIIQRTWRKMTDHAHKFALSGKLALPEPLVPLIQKALA
jgi:hypothetical protein